jgi:hypothetical protein
VHMTKLRDGCGVKSHSGATTTLPRTELSEICEGKVPQHGAVAAIHQSVS